MKRRIFKIRNELFPNFTWADEPGQTADLGGFAHGGSNMLRIETNNTRVARLNNCTRRNTINLFFHPRAFPSHRVRRRIRRHRHGWMKRHATPRHNWRR